MRLVQVQVQEILPSGLRVRILGDSRVGFIRRRELSWDRRISADTIVPRVGEQIEARIIGGRRGGRYVYLSLRQLVDPWKESIDKYQVGHLVRGEVVNVRRFGAFVQIEPGIDAIIRPNGIPMLMDQGIENVLAVGDRVQGLIAELDPRKRRIEISIIEWLRHLSSLTDEERIRAQLTPLGDKVFSRGTGDPEVSPRMMPTHASVVRRYHAPIPRLGRILVVDDHGPGLQRICRHIRDTLEIEVDPVQSGRQALTAVRAGQSYDVAVVDLRLDGEHGALVAEELRMLRPDLPILFTSADPLAEQELTSIDGRTFPFAFRDPKEIVECIDRLYNGYWEELCGSEDAVYAGSGSFIQQLGMTAFVRQSLPELLQEMLERLRLETGVSRCLVLEVDRLQKTASILAADPPLDPDIEKQSLDGLYYSPVRTVIEDEESFYATSVKQDFDPRFRHFFPLLAFRVCYGIPLTVPGLVTRHALFLLDERRSQLEGVALDSVRTSARFLEVALERALLLDYMRRYEQRYSRGQLLGSLVHELANKVEALSGPAQTLPSVLQQVGGAGGSSEQAEQLAVAMEIAAEIAQAQEGLGDLVTAYQQMASGTFEGIDLSAVVRRVAFLFASEARDSGIDIHVQEEADLPLAKGIRSRLEQILINLVLNAIQQIDRQKRLMERIAREGKSTALLQCGQVILLTQRSPAGAPYPVQIVVADTGPGIHYLQQQRMFMLDTSTRRGGHGLGLFISRNLAETMGGRIRLADSLLFVGSVFVIELPVFSENGA